MPPDGLSTTLVRSPAWETCGGTDCRSTPDLPEARFADSGWPKRRELALLWFALQRLANFEQEDGTLVFCVGGKKVDQILVEEGHPGRTQVIGVCSQVDPAADGTCLYLDGPVAAVPVSLQNAV